MFTLIMLQASLGDKMENLLHKLNLANCCDYVRKFNVKLSFTLSC